LILQLEPAAATIVTNANRLHYGPERERAVASHIVTVPGDTLRAIIAEFRGAFSVGFIDAAHGQHIAR
jgi:hypothetical protein